MEIEAYIDIATNCINEALLHLNTKDPITAQLLLRASNLLIKIAETKISESTGKIP